jgi:hypothetical protein
MNFDDDLVSYLAPADFGRGYSLTSAPETPPAATGGSDTGVEAGVAGVRGRPKCT